MVDKFKASRLKWLWVLLLLVGLWIVPQIWGLTIQSYKYGSVERVQATLQAHPDDAQAHLILGEALSAQGKLDEALVHFRDAVRLKPGKPKYQNSLAMALDRSGHEAEALKIYRSLAAGSSKYASTARIRLRLEQEYIKNGRQKSIDNLKH